MEDLEIKLLKQQHPPHQSSLNEHLVDEVDECVVIQLKVEQLAQQIVFELLNNKDHSQRLPFSGIPIQL